MESQGRRKRTKHDRSYWEEQIKLWQDSQLTQNQYCRESKVSQEKENFRVKKNRE